MTKTIPIAELYQAIYELLNGNISYDTINVPVYVERANRDVSGNWVHISQFNETPTGTKLRFGGNCSVLIEIMAESGNVIAANSIADQVMELMQPKKAAKLTLTNYSNPIIFEPNVTTLIELTEVGQIYRIQLRYILLIDKK